VEKSVYVADNLFTKYLTKNDTIMILLLDAGNSFIKWAWLDPSWLKAGSGDSPELTNHDELLHAGEDLLLSLEEAWSEFPVPTQVWLSNVAGDDVLAGLQSWVSEHWACPVEVASSQASFGDVINAYSEPARLGVDRWLGLLAARDAQPGPCAVIDCGSAITVDAMDASGQHLGGLILPGLKMMRDSLYAEAEGVETAEPEQTSAGMLFATNTTTGVEVGSLYAIVAFVERVINDMQKEMGTDLVCILTGGDAEGVLPLLSVEVMHRPSLVLEGLTLYIGREASV